MCKSCATDTARWKETLNEGEIISLHVDKGYSVLKYKTLEIRQFQDYDEGYDWLIGGTCNE